MCNEQIYYHGTSNIFEIQEILPASETRNLRESFRKNKTNVVFITDSYISAYQYAKKASNQYGGDPIVYQVLPDEYIIPLHNHEYITNKAQIVKIIKK